MKHGAHPHEKPHHPHWPLETLLFAFVFALGWRSVHAPETWINLKTGAKILAEIVGYGATSDGYDMVAPSGEGAERCMKMALSTVKVPIDYINPHATSTPAGDPPEIGEIRNIFGNENKCPPISATNLATLVTIEIAGTVVVYL